jgi:hypothetical protein
VTYIQTECGEGLAQRKGVIAKGGVREDDRDCTDRFMATSAELCHWRTTICSSMCLLV